MLARKTGKKAFVAADAGTDILCMAALHLRRPVRIREHLMRKSHVIQRAFTDHFLRYSRIPQFSISHNRNADNRFDGLLRVQLVSLTGVDSGDRLVPFLIAACIDMKSRDASLFEDFCHFDAFVDRAEAFHSLIRCKFDKNREILWCIGPDRFNTLQCKAHPVLQRSAVFIRPVIPLRGMELIKKIAAVGMQLYCIRACVDGQACRISDFTDQIPDVLYGKWFADQIREPEGRHASRGIWRGKRIRELLPAKARRKLYADLRAKMVAAVNQHVEAFHVVEIRQLRTWSGLVFCGNNVSAGNDESCPALCPFGKVIDCVDVVGSISFPRRSHRGHEDAVLQLHRTQRGLIKKCVHRSSPLHEGIEV